MSNISPTFEVSLFGKVADKMASETQLTSVQANSGDVHTFESALHHDPLANTILGGVDHVSNSIAEKKIAFEKSLLKATESKDPADMVNTARALSEYSLHTAIITKAASKTSQAIQKVTSPQ
jgi:type III secretion system YscI/HrpB-like protein